MPTSSLIPGRIEQLRASQFPADAFLVTDRANVRYLCGFTGSAGVLLIEEDRARLFTDGRYTLQARREVSAARIEVVRGGLFEAAGNALRQSAGGKSKPRGARYRVAFSLHLTVAQKRILDAAAGGRIRWVSAADAIEKLRARKDEAEIEQVRGAARIIDRVLETIAGVIKPGMTELGVAAEIEYAIRKAGGEGPSFETIVASGRRSAWPHARPSAKPLGKNELVVLDQGAILRGYCSDLTRTVFLGRAPRRIKAIYEAVREAQQAAKAAIRPGATADEVDGAARRVLRRGRLAQYFTHSTGHGLGLEAHERPRLGRGDQTVLAPGMVLTVEPGVYVEGMGGIRIEDDVLVTSNGAEDLTACSRELREI